LALALLRQPRLLIVDEPTTALDALTREAMVSLLQTLRARRTAPLPGGGPPTLWLVTHDLDVAQALADQVLVLDEGRVVDRGTPPRCWQGFAAPAARALVAAWPDPLAATTAPRRPPADAPVVLEARGLSLRYGGGAPALQPTDLRLVAGERVAIVGRSGSGKSSLARALAGLADGASGSLTWEGRAFDPQDRRARRALQWLPQDAGGTLDPALPVGRAIAEARRAHDLPCDEAVVTAALRRVDLPSSVAGQRPGALSTGQRQRVAIARTLAVEPRLLLLDEPLTGLDPLRAQRLCDLLVSLAAAQGLTVCTVLHELAHVPVLADRVLVLHEGRIVEDVPVPDLFARPRHPASIALVDAARRAASLSDPSGA
jgi:ABC-type glutathione transport system ATPase component